MADPSTETWRATFAASGQFTSAQLRSAELEIEGVREELTRQDATNEDLRATLAMRTRALAASQADLTAMQAERDVLAVLNAELRAEAKEWRAIAERYLIQRDDALHDLAHAKFALSTAKTRLDHWKEQAESALHRLSELEGTS